jgi:hypothetical protein
MDRTYKPQTLTEWPVPFHFKDVISMRSFKECFAVKEQNDTKAPAAEERTRDLEVSSIGLVFTT